MKTFCVLALIFAFSAFGNCQQNGINEEEENKIAESARFFLFPNGNIPSMNSGGCVLASLARLQSMPNPFDIFLKLSPIHRRYRQCPTEADLNQFNDERQFKKRIFGGTEAQPGEFPWMVYMYELQTCNPVCGGTVLNSKWVLTAAHCIGTVNPSIYGLVLGEHRISTINANERHRLVSQIVIHPRYDPVPFNYDVALLKLQKPVTFSRYLRPACLLPSGTGTDRFQEPTLIGDSSCTAMGWGVTEIGGEPTDVLMSVPLPIAPRPVCNAVTLLAASAEQPAVFENDPKFCAGGEANQDTCMGDSGGPLICNINGTFNIVGVTSYGPNPCGQVGQFGVYAKLADPEINGWISTEIQRW